MWCYVAFWVDKSPIETAVKSVCFSSTPRFVYKTTYIFFNLLPTHPYVQTVDPKVQENKYEVRGTNKVNEISIWCSAMTQKTETTTYTSSFHSLTFAWVTNKGTKHYF